MIITAGIHFTEYNIKIVFMNKRFETLETIKAVNNSIGFSYLQDYLLKKYQPSKLRFVIEKEHFDSQLFSKMLLEKGYIFVLIPPIIYRDPIYNLMIAIPSKKTRFYKPFIRAAMLWIPSWNRKFNNFKNQKYDQRQLSLF